MSPGCLLEGLIDQPSLPSHSPIAERLERSGVPFVVLVAPAGFGKTTAAATYSAGFARRLTLACEVGMTSAAALKRLLNTVGCGDESPEFASVWQGNEPTCVLIDAAENLADEVLKELLVSILRCRPEQGCVVVCTRRDPLAFAFSEIVGPHQQMAFRRSDLELTFSQFEALARPDVDRAKLYDAYWLSRGWPVVAVSLLASIAGGALATGTRFYDHPALRDLLDWVDRETISTLAPEIHDALLHCVVCPDVRPSDYDGAYGDVAWRPDRQLYRSLQFADIGDSGEIRVHPIIVFALRAQRAKALARVGREVAAQFLDRGEPLRAARTLLCVGALAEAGAIVDDLGFEEARDFGGFPYPGLSLERHSGGSPAFERFPLLWLNLVPSRFYVVPAASLAREGAAILRDYDRDLPARLRNWVTATVVTLFAEIGDRESAERYAGMLSGEGDDVAACIDVAEMYLDVFRGQFRSVLERWKRTVSHYRGSQVWYTFHLRCNVRALVRLGDPGAGIDALRVALSSLPFGGSPSLAGFGAMEGAALSWLREDDVSFRQFRRDFSRIALRYDVPVLWRCLSAFFGHELGGVISPQLHDILSVLILACNEPDAERGRELALKAVAAADGGRDASLQISARIVAVTRGAGDANQLKDEAKALAALVDSSVLTASVNAFAAGHGDIGFFQHHVDRVHKAMQQRDATVSATVGLAIDLASIEVLRGEEVVKTSEGTTQILVLLAVHHEANRDFIVDRLWPDLDGDAAASALKMCVHRARQQLGDPSAIRVEKSVYSLGAGMGSNYEAILATARIVRPLSADQRKVHATLFDRLTNGMASGRASWPWFVSFARALADANRRLGEQLGEEELERGDPQAALQIGRKMLAADPLDETGCSLVLRAYGKLGNWPAAKREFDEFRKILKSQINTEPSARLARLLESS